MTENDSRQVPCPSCGEPASGNFCQHCGAALGGRFCNQCGTKLDAGAKFCNQCGAPAGAPLSRPGAASAPAPGGAAGAGGAARRSGGASRARADAATSGSNLPWWIAGAAIFGLILFVGFSMIGNEGPSAPAGGGMPAGGLNPNGPATTDISQMSPREAADRLFNRVMSTIAQGDTAGGMGFLPMAINAYGMVQPLDLDGHFHLGMLHMLQDPTAAAAEADTILQAEPDHILGLGLAAEAALAQGDSAKARELYQHLLDVFDAQAGRPLPEYQGHQTLLANYRSTAQGFLAGG